MIKKLLLGLLLSVGLVHAQTPGITYVQMYPPTAGQFTHTPIYSNVSSNTYYPDQTALSVSGTSPIDNRDVLALEADGWTTYNPFVIPSLPASAALLGTTAAGIFQPITLGANLSLSGTTLNAAGGGGSPIPLSSLASQASGTNVGLPPNNSAGYPLATPSQYSQNIYAADPPYNVKADWCSSEIGNCLTNIGSITTTANSSTITSSAYTFTAADVGKIVGIDNAGPTYYARTSAKISSAGSACVPGTTLTISGGSGTAATLTEQACSPTVTASIASNSITATVSGASFNGYITQTTPQGYGGTLTVSGAVTGTIATGQAVNYTTATFTGYISGTTLTVSSGLSGTIAAGNYVMATGATNQTTIVSGSNNTWVVSPSQTLGSSGSPVAITLLAMPPNTVITGGSSTTWTLNNSSTVGSSGSPVGLVTYPVISTTQGTGQPASYTATFSAGALSGLGFQISPGYFVVNPSTLSSVATSLVGAGTVTGSTTLNLGTVGIYTVSLASAGNYSAVPSNPVSVTGADTTPTFTMSWWNELIATITAYSGSSATLSTPASHSVSGQWNFGHDNAAAINNAIAAAEVSSTAFSSGYCVMLPQGAMLISSTININGALCLSGVSIDASTLIAEDAMTVPMMLVQMTGTNFESGTTYSNQDIYIHDLGFYSPDKASANVAFPGQDCLDTLGGTNQIFAHYNRIRCGIVTGNGIGWGTTGGGTTTPVAHSLYYMEHIYAQGNGGRGFASNSGLDSTLKDSQFGENGLEGGVFNSDQSIVLDDTQFWQNGQQNQINYASNYGANACGVRFYGTVYMAIGGGRQEFNGNRSANLCFDHPGAATTVRLTGEVEFGGASTPAPGVFPDVWTINGSPGAVFTIQGNPQFFVPGTNTQGQITSTYNFDGANSPKLATFCQGCTTVAGASPVISNTYSPYFLSITGTSANSQSPATPVGWDINGPILDELQVYSSSSSAGYLGFEVVNPGGEVAALHGCGSGGNDGCMEGFDSGTSTKWFRIGANPAGTSLPNFIDGNYFYFGNSNANASPHSVIISGTGGNGTNSQGAPFTIQAGPSTGNAVASNIQFNCASPNASGSTPQTESVCSYVNGATGAFVQGSTPLPTTLLNGGLPFIIGDSGTITSGTGNFTLGTALPSPYTSYVNAYYYFPANALNGANSAGWYYVQMSSTTQGVVYTTTYTSGTPTVPASPTAFTTTGGSGSWTGVTTTVPGPTYSLPGNLLGPNGEVQFDFAISVPGSTNQKNWSVNYAGNITGSGSTVASTTTAQTAQYRFMNAGVTGTQVGTAGSGGGFGANAITRNSVDSTTTHSLTINAWPSVATDYVVIELYSMKAFPQ